jgi:Holliday junction resolvase RusA-like endonuclease
VISIVIPCKPFAKQRPRFARKGGRVYTPKPTLDYEAMVAALLRDAIPEPLTGPVRLAIYAHFKIAKSWSAKKKDDLIWTPHLQTPDLDNIVKAISDAANGIAFKDDSQIADLVCKKVWSHTDQVLVTIKQFNFFNIGRDDV